MVGFGVVVVVVVGGGVAIVLLIDGSDVGLKVVGIPQGSMTKLALPLEDLPPDFFELLLLLPSTLLLVDLSVLPCLDEVFLEEELLELLLEELLLLPLLLEESFDDDDDDDDSDASLE